MLAAIALFLLGIIPGILYLILRRPRPVYTTVAVRDLGNSTSELALSGDDPRMQDATIRWWGNRIGKPPP